MRIEWKDVIEAADQNDWPIKYEYVRVWTETESPGLKMVGYEYPVGMKENEINFMYNTIVRNNLRSGFEIATGFGASTYGLGMAFKETKGKLVTLDAYIEEARQNPNGYKNEQTYHPDDPVGFRSVNQLIEFGKLEKIVFPEIGYSPTAVEPLIKKHQIEELDFILIDGGHWDDAVIRDIEALGPFLKKDAWIFLHDTHCLSRSLEHIREKFGKPITTPKECKPPHGWNLSYVG